ncbi:hypothetical protein [Methylobacterium oxalidis]|nr:hypothetical protein [Methylobacterium oxalidis]
MGDPTYRRLPSGHLDRLLIETSREAIERSRELLERTEPLVTGKPAEAPVSQARKVRPK